MRNDFKWREVYAKFVNLAHRTDRLAHMQQEIGKLGIIPERFEAIRTTDNSWCREPYITMFRRTKGAIGCMLSQMEIMKEALDRNVDCMVMEDDLKVCQDFPERMDYAERFLNTHPWDIFWCGATVSVNPPYWNVANNRELPLANPLWRDAECTDDPRILRTFGCFCTYCYVINRDSLLKILNLLDSVMSESIGIDHSMIRLQPQLNTFCLVPGSVFQIDNLSDIGQGVTNFTPFLKLNGTLENSAYVFQDKMDSFNPLTFDWAEAKAQIP
jgi:GR25 family glycosyltransferase involved in LPS biosynthesis